MTDLVAQLKQAFCRGDATGVRRLLECHPDLKSHLDEPIGSFDSPLIVNTPSREMLDVLLEAGAEINARSRWWAGGFGLLDSAKPELAEYAIARGAIVDVHAAARLGLMERLRELIAADPQLVHARGGDGQTPLHFAGTIEVARFLLEHGAAIDVRDVDHESTPAQYMVRDRQEVARFLVSQDCTTDLLLASALGDADLARRLLETDPESIRLRVSERHFPKKNPRSGGTIYIWTLGAAKTPHAVAREFGHHHVLDVLMRHTPDDLALAVAAENADEAAVNDLLARRPGLVDQMTKDDLSRIADAARTNATETVRLMLVAGWPVDARAQHGATPLHWAAFHGNAVMVDMLLRRRAPLEVADADYQSTPMGWAIHGSEHGWHRDKGNYPATVQALVAAGAKVPPSAGDSDLVRKFQRPSKS